jgi:hypothetical protein
MHLYTETKTNDRTKSCQHYLDQARKDSPFDRLHTPALHFTFIFIAFNFFLLDIV